MYVKLMVELNEQTMDRFIKFQEKLFSETGFKATKKSVTEKALNDLFDKNGV